MNESFIILEVTRLCFQKVLTLHISVSRVVENCLLISTSSSGYNSFYFCQANGYKVLTHFYVPLHFPIKFEHLFTNLLAVCICAYTDYLVIYSFKDIGLFIFSPRNFIFLMMRGRNLSYFFWLMSCLSIIF